MGIKKAVSFLREQQRMDILWQTCSLRNYAACMSEEQNHGRNNGKESGAERASATGQRNHFARSSVVVGFEVFAKNSGLNRGRG